jgi:pimeloyl-ACP methyl ester carboxylesterase
MNRRSVVTGVAAGIAALTSRSATGKQRSVAKQTFVLVHGAWHGGWCWKYVRDILVSQGHAVFTPTLTGQGERSHLSRPDIDIVTHIQDIVRVIEAEELERVVLVGHSYGGIVISGVAEKLSKKIQRLIFLDALLPKAGEPVFQLPPEIAKTLLNGFELSSFPAEMFGVPKDHPLYGWVARQLTTMPVKTLTTPVLVTGAWAKLPKSFIACSGNGLDGPKAGARQAKTEKWDFHTLATGHDAMVTMPLELAQLLARLA